jgi:type II secretory pathway pseudopilin PulG
MKNATTTRRGLSIAEVMISLTISSFLLVAVATAYSTSADAVEMNDKFFRATQAGRVTMNQVLTEIRRAESVLCSAAGDSIIVTRPGETRAATFEVSREYKYNATAKTVTLQIYYDKAGVKSTSPLYTMARNIESTSFGPPDKVTQADGTQLEVRVPVTVEVKLGSHKVRLSGSSSPRRVSLG